MMRIQRAVRFGALATALVLLLAQAVHGQGSNNGTNLQALVTESLNPVGHMVKLPLQNNFDFGVGPDKVTQYTLNIEPIIPFRLNDEWNLVTRAVIPIINQPSAGPDRPSATGLGDINPALFLSPSRSHGQFYGFGPTCTLPTGTSPSLTSGEWSLGPAAVYLATPGPWMIGAFANQQWSVAGWGERNVSLTTLQPMAIYHLPRGWYLVSVPIITANWEVRSDDRWTVPVGGGAGKIVKLGKVPMNLQLQAFYNVEHPREGADWQLRFQMLFLFPK
jgi:hypothetical protein